tara:strand:- start:986 stop:1756 length:771 start_codon:yes stop_codon:yes gene_type:complete
MDIIIRNGVIQKEDAKRIREIKNKEGLLKKNYNECYIRNTPGPYYDLINSHICIPRWWYQIRNFTGPQIKNRLRLYEETNFNKKCKYCCICHCAIKQNMDCSSKRKLFYNEDIFEKKKELKLDKIEESFQKLDIHEELSVDLVKNILNLNIKDITEKWLNFYKKLNKINNENIKLYIFSQYKKKQSKILFKYYKLIYKLIKKPILYPITNTETKLIWPWDLTYYQKFRLKNLNYKNNIIFSHKNSYKINSSYVIIS